MRSDQVHIESNVGVDTREDLQPFPLSADAVPQRGTVRVISTALPLERYTTPSATDLATVERERTREKMRLKAENVAQFRCRLKKRLAKGRMAAAAAAGRRNTVEEEAAAFQVVQSKFLPLINSFIDFSHRRAQWLWYQWRCKLWANQETKTLLIKQIKQQDRCWGPTAFGESH